MASTVLFVNTKGDEVVSRHFRSDIQRSSIDAFRSKVIATKSTGSTPPVCLVDGATFVYIRHRNLYLIAATRRNPNTLLMLEYLRQLITILRSYLGDKFNDDSLRANFTLVYELFDETMDHGYPQNCSVDVLKLYINQGSQRGGIAGALTGTTGAAGAATGSQLTAQITGAIDWRREGIRYRNNEVFIDVQEVVNLQIGSAGQVLRSEINGRIAMRALLSGMPECKLGLNDKLIMERENPSGPRGVELDDCSFHRCVRLGKFDSERTITFIPPDGEFELMRYRVANAGGRQGGNAGAVNGNGQVTNNTFGQIFSLIPSITETSKNCLSVNLKIRADFPESVKAVQVVVRIPMPPTAASARFRLGKGRAKYDPAQRALVWKIPVFQGGTEFTLDAAVDLLPATRERAWVRPPLSLDFQLPMYCASGVQVRFLKVYEKSSYQHNKWVKYLTKSGDYQMKI